MPEVIFKKFIVSILIGVGFLCGGVIGMVTYHDTPLLMLSVIIFIGAVVKDGVIYYRFKKNRYIKIVGTVLTVNKPLFVSNKSVEVETDEGTIKLYLPKEVKIKLEKRYCFYFSKDTGKSPVIINNYITAKLNTDNFIGCESMENILEKTPAENKTQ